MAQRIDVSLEGLHQMLHRIERKELVDGDWAICGALVLQLIVKSERRQERMLAKLAVEGVSPGATEVIDGRPIADLCGSPVRPSFPSQARWPTAPRASHLLPTAHVPPGGFPQVRLSLRC